MSSLLQTLQALSSQRGMPGATADNGLSSTQGKGPDGQAFSSLMNQFRDGQGSASAQQKAAATATAAPKDPAAATRAARATADRSSQNLAAQRQAVAQRDAAEARPVAAEKAKAPVKAAQPKPPQPVKAKAAEKSEGDDGKATSENKADDSQEVAFTTDQGQASAWVKELQPPADVPSSDPAAMLAWLSGLSKGDAPAGELGDMSELAGGAGEGQGKGSAGVAGLPGADIAKPGATPSWSVQALQSDQGADLSKGSKGSDGALSLEELGMTPVADEAAQQSSPLEFNALMAREMARPAGVGTQGTDSARHYTGSLATPVDSPDFQQALADRVGMWISGPAASGPMTAELRLNPTEMGPVQIRIVLDGNNAQVDFAAAHADTREAIEASLQTLSTQLEEAGLSLSGGGVSDQNAGQSWRGDHPSDRADGWNGNGRSQGQGGASGERLVDQGQIGAQLATRAAAASRAGGLDLYA